MSIAAKAGGVKLIQFEKGDFLFHEGDQTTNVYLIKSGAVSVFRSTATGSMELGILKENQLVGEMAFLDQSPRSASAQATQPTIAYELQTEKFSAYLKTQPDWLLIIIESLLKRIRTLNEKIESKS